MSWYDKMVAAGGSKSLTTGVVVEYRTLNREVAGSTYTRSTASNLEQVENLLCAQAKLSLLLSAEREMSSSYGYGVKA